MHLERESHVFNVNTLLGPWDGFSIVAGAQADWTRQKGFALVTEAIPAFGITNRPDINSRIDRTTVEENVRLRYTKIPFTVLFAEGRLQQESLDHSEELLGAGFQDFLRDTDASSDLRDLRAGFSTSPWRRATLTAHYRWYEKLSSYKEPGDIDIAPTPIGPMPNEGYSSFIRSRDLQTDEIEARLAIRATSWLKTTLSWKHLNTDFDTETDAAFPAVVSPGGWIDAGEYEADIYSVGVVLTPWRRFYLATTLAWLDTSTETADNGSPAVVPYRGDVYSVLSSATYALSERTDLHASYSFSRANYRQHNEGAGLPLGIEYHRHGVQAGITRRWTRTVSTRLQYAFYDYDEPSGGHLNDYTAHGVFASLTLRWP